MKFDHVVTAIEESKDLANYSLNELKGSLLAHEDRMGRSAEKNIEHAFHSKADILSKENGVGSRYAGRGRSSSGYRGRGRGQGRSIQGHQNYGRGHNGGEGNQP